MMIILVDLDGTLTDPASGIISAFQHAVRSQGLEPPPASELGWVIGPPLRTVFPKILGPDADIEAAVASYREQYGAGGLFDASVYEGIETALTELRKTVDERNGKLFVCTAKPAHFATRVVSHFKLDKHFHALYGPDLAGKLDDKGDLIAHMIEVEGFEPKMAVMIGDRGSDVKAAKRHGIPTVGCKWGYGSEEELSEAGAATLCETPFELVDAVEKLWLERRLN
jgi:phosphoglycolate phosphatase